jgi:hypothetical protein
MVQGGLLEASLGRVQGEQEQSRECKVPEVRRIPERCSRSSLRTIISLPTLPHGTGGSETLFVDYGIVRHGCIALALHFSWITGGTVALRLPCCAFPVHVFDWNIWTAPMSTQTSHLS